MFTESKMTKEWNYKKLREEWTKSWKNNLKPNIKLYLRLEKAIGVSVFLQPVVCFFSNYVNRLSCFYYMSYKDCKEQGV